MELRGLKQIIAGEKIEEINFESIGLKKREWDEFVIKMQNLLGDV
jgi:hypothetical protein